MHVNDHFAHPVLI